MLIRHKDTLHELNVPDETDLGFFPAYEPVEPEPATEAPSPRLGRKSSAALEESGVPTE